jgi:hypothetical protein
MSEVSCLRLGVGGVAMIKATAFAAGGFLLVTLIGPCIAAEQRFSCKGGIIEPSGEQKTPVDINLSLDGNGKMSLKTSDDKTLASRITSNNKIQLKFTTSEFVGEFFHYTGDLFLIYKSGQLGRLNCSHT